MCEIRGRVLGNFVNSSIRTLGRRTRCIHFIVGRLVRLALARFLILSADQFDEAPRLAGQVQGVHFVGELSVQMLLIFVGVLNAAENVAFAIGGHRQADAASCGWPQTTGLHAHPFPLQAGRVIFCIETRKIRETYKNFVLSR